MGYSLGKLVTDLKIADESLQSILQNLAEIPLPTAFAYATEALGVPHEAALLVMLFSLVENQVLACVKPVPLGQFQDKVYCYRYIRSLNPLLSALNSWKMMNFRIGRQDYRYCRCNMKHSTAGFIDHKLFK